MTTQTDPRWHLAEDKEEGWKRVMNVARLLDDQLELDKLRMARAARLYDPTIEIAGTHLDVVGALMADRGPVTMNVCKANVDTVTSMIAKNRPRATFMTDNADYTTTQRAKDLERFVEGQFGKSEVYDDAVRMFHVGTMVGLGALKIEEDDGEPCVDVVLPWDLVVDKAECMVGKPRQLHHLRFVDREVLKSLYPDDAEQIELVSAADTVRRWSNYRQVDTDLIPLVESWRLPSSKGAGDGKHALCLDGHALVWEDWEEDYFPFVFYRWAERLNNFFGVGLIEEIAGIQNKINKINSYITKCHDLANSYLLVQAADAGLKIKSTGGSDPLQLMPYKGQIKPEFITPPLVQPELYQHLDYLIQQSRQLSGISEMAATSQKPAELESAIALQTFNDIETQRFSIQAQRYERAVLEIARQMVRLMHRIGNDDIQVRWNSRNLARTIKWKDVKIDEDLYIMSIEAASIQSRLPSGRIQAAIELGNSGLLPPDEVKRLVGHPDIERTMTLENAAKNHAESIVEKLSRGETVVPEAADMLPVAIRHVALAFVTIKDKDAPQDVLDAFRFWMRRALAELKKAPPEMTDPLSAIPQPQPPGMVAPPGPGMAMTPGVMA